MSNLNRGKIVNRAATVRIPVIARSPVVRHQVDPILVQSTTNQPEQAPRDVPQYKITQEPMLPSVSASKTSYNSPAIIVHITVYNPVITL